MGDEGPVANLCSVQTQLRQHAANFTWPGVQNGPAVYPAAAFAACAGARGIYQSILPFHHITFTCVRWKGGGPRVWHSVVEADGGQAAPPLGGVAQRDLYEAAACNQAAHAVGPRGKWPLKWHSCHSLAPHSPGSGYLNRSSAGRIQILRHLCAEPSHELQPSPCWQL